MLMFYGVISACRCACKLSSGHMLQGAVVESAVL